jgi:hypothetical protein
MTTKPKSAVDPIFAAIAEHEALIKETNRLEDSYRIAKAKAESEAIVSPFYDRWNRACRAERKVAIRVARTIPATRAGVEAMIHHAHQAIETDREVDWRDWVPTVLKTVSRALVGTA